MGKMTDTDERLQAIADRTAESTAERIADKLSHRPQGPLNAGDSSEQMRKAHYHACENEPDGPACKLSERLDEMEKTMGKAIRGLQDAETARNAVLEGIAKRNLRWAQVCTGIAAVSTVMGFILSHWPHK